MSPLPTDLDDVSALRARLRGALPPSAVAPEAPEVDDAWEPGRVRWTVSGRAALAVVVALLVVVVGLAVRTWRDGPGEVIALPALTVPASAPLVPTAPGAPRVTGAAPSTGAGDGTAAGAPAILLVHVVGHVRRPGVVELPTGSRVIDAIEAAGGATRKGDPTALNLAAPVSDGEQLRVPAPGEAPAVRPTAAATPGGAVSGGAPGLVDLNTADVAALDTLPGIGPVLAERIVAHREQHGPFASVESLEDVSGVGPATLAKLRDHLSVG